MKKKSLLLISFLFILFFTVNGMAREDEDIMAARKTAEVFSKVAKKAMPTVVFIKVEKKIEGFKRLNPFSYGTPNDLFNDEFFRRFFDPRFRGGPQTPQKEYRQMSQGSGFIISRDGYIMTNHHVVEGADKITVILKNGQKFTAKLVGSDDKSDVALIKVDAARDLPSIELGNSDSLDVGHWVIAIGNPFGLSHTMTVGVVSAKGRTNVGLTDYENFIQTDAAINPGNSGGPLINIRGEVVGINTAIFSKSGGYMGIGFAIPINMAKNIEEQLVKRGKVTRGYLGVMIQNIDENLAKSFGLDSNQGVLIANVTEGSAADKGGMERGDVVLIFDGRKAENVGQFRNQVALTEPGKKVEVEIIRRGKKKSLTLKIGTLENISAVGITPGVAKNLGIAVKPLTRQLAEQFSFGIHGGVLVSAVENGSPAELAGIRPGMLILEVNRKAVKSVEEFDRLLNNTKKGSSVLFLLKSDKYTNYVSIRIP